MADITDAHVAFALERDFPAAMRPAARAQLLRYGMAAHETSPAFLRLAVLRLANGDLAKLIEWVELAKWDYRDVLLAIHQTYGTRWTEPFLSGGGLILTQRLALVPATVALTRAALSDHDALARGLGALIPATWPPELLDPPALQFTLDRLSEGPEQAGWWLYFVLRASGQAGRTLIGSVGYKGPPSADGTVEVGYGIVREYQRQGYASEAVRGLLAHAFALPAVRRVIAETFPELTPSLGVLRKCGFRLIGQGSEPGVIRFELTRAEYLAPAAISPQC